MSREDIGNKIWRACDIMRRDDGTTGIIEYMEQLSWMLFLKAFENIEDNLERKSEEHQAVNYTRAIFGPYRWSVWTGSRRKRAESKVAEARLLLNKLNIEFRRLQERIQGDKNGKQSKNLIEDSVGSSRKLTDKQALQAIQSERETAEKELQEAEKDLNYTIAWLEDQVKSLFDERSVEEQVLRIIARQFRGNLDLTPRQLKLLRDAEKEKGLALSKKLVEGIRDDYLLTFVDDYLFPYLRHLDGSTNQRILANIFKEIPGNRMRSAANLKEVIELLDDADFQDEEDTQLVSQVYEDLLSRLGAESGIAGEFYTPRPIIRFMVQVIDPQIGETVYDPFCGSAGFLVEAYKYLHLSERTTEENDLVQRQTFFGQEKKPLPALLGIMNMMLHGVLTPNISRVNTLEEDVRENQKTYFDIILTNPPFGGKEGAHIQKKFAIQNSATELLALQHVTAKLSPHGRCGVVVPEGILFRGEAFAAFKEQLLKNFNLYALISLPAGVFANAASSGTGPKTNILFFDRFGPTKQIWYYEVNQVGFTLTKAQRSISENDLPDVMKMLRMYHISLENGTEPPLNENCWIVPIDQIQAPDYDLTARNPNKTEEYYTHHSPEVLIADIAAKHQRMGEILSEMQEWLTNNTSV